MDEVRLARADRGQVWKPVQPFALTVVLGAALVWWVDEARAWVAAGFAVSVFGVLFLSRIVTWSAMGDLFDAAEGLVYRPRRGEDFQLPWQDLKYGHFERGALALPQWYVGRWRGPLPVLHLHLRDELQHDRTPNCPSDPVTPGLEGLGPHADRQAWAVWDLSLLLRPRDLPEVERRLAAAFDRRGIPFDGPTRHSGRAQLPWRDADDQGATSG